MLNATALACTLIERGVDSTCARGVSSFVRLVGLTRGKSLFSADRHDRQIIRREHHSLSVKSRSDHCPSICKSSSSHDNDNLQFRDQLQRGIRRGWEHLRATSRHRYRRLPNILLHVRIIVSIQSMLHTRSILLGS